MIGNLLTLNSLTDLPFKKKKGYHHMINTHIGDTEQSNSPKKSSKYCEDILFSSYVQKLF